MLFNSVAFLAFFFVVLTVYYVIPQRFKWIALLTASIFFYLCFTPAHIVVLLGITAVSYGVGLLVYQGNQKGPKQKFWLAVGVVACFSTLFVYKYLDFAASLVYRLLASLNVPHTDTVFTLALPVGISFFIFKAVSYMVDSYRGKIVEKNVFKYLLYVSFFPQIASGPIERSTNFFPELNKEHKFLPENVQQGLYLMLVGYFKKMVVADNLSGVVSTMFSEPESQSSVALILIACTYSIQIFCDFSGYSDIAIGCAKALGVNTAQNFNHPYFSASIGSFWRNWHISLSSWFRDYLYIPLGGNRKGVARKYFNLLVVFLVSGLWHGAALTFVFWGLLHAVYQIIGGLTAPLRARWNALIRLTKHPKLHKAIGIIITFGLVTLAWIFFRADTIAAGFNYVKCMLFNLGESLNFGAVISQIKLLFHSKNTLISFCVAMVSFLVFEFVDYKKDLYSVIKRRHWAIKVVFYALLIVFILLFASTAVTDFIYVRF